MKNLELMINLEKSDKKSKTYLYIRLKTNNKSRLTAYDNGGVMEPKLRTIAFSYVYQTKQLL